MSKDNGVSKAALSLARRVDRLTPGEYTIELAKTSRPAGIVYSIEREQTAEVGRETKSSSTKD